MKSQAHTPRAWTAIVSIMLGFAALIISAINVWVGNRQVNVAIDTLRLAQAAWVVPDRLEILERFEVPDGDQLEIPITWRNTGHVPALDVQANAFLAVFGKDEDFEPRSPNILGSRTIRAGVLGPGSPLRQVVRARIPVGGEFRSALKSQGLALVLHSCMTFVDGFEKNHWMTFCARYNAGVEAFDLCEEYNESGLGDPPIPCAELRERLKDKRS